jgi:hypothetical protein
MRSNRLPRVGRLLIALLALCAFGAIAAASAQAATEGPFWKVGGRELEENETREITARAYEGTIDPIRLEAELLGLKAKVECHLASLAKGAFIAGGVPGTTEGIAEFSDCTAVNVGQGCEVEEPIVTKKIRGELVVSDEKGNFGKFILMEFDPATGTEGEFATIKFRGPKCIIGGAGAVVGKGLVVGAEYTDPLVSGGEAKQVTTIGALEETSFLIKFPDEFTDNEGVKSVWLFRNNIFELVKITPFKSFGNEARLIGTLLYLLADGEKYGQAI